MENLMARDSAFHLREDLWYDIQEYKEDYKMYVERREYSRFHFHHLSPQIKKRREMVEYLKFVATKKKATFCCLHLSVYLLDLFMDNHSIIYERLYLVANVCFIIAAKVEGGNECVIKFCELNDACGIPYDLNDYKHVEIMILNFFNWYVLFPTAATYIHYYLQEAITENEMTFLQIHMQESPRSILMELHNKIRMCLDKILDDIHYMQYYSPSKLAASAIAAARLRLGLNCWSLELEILTGYEAGDLQNCFTNLLKFDRIYCDLCNVNSY